MIEPSQPLIWNWHIDVLCNRFQRHLLRQTEKQNLYLGIPPGSMKSTIVSVASLPWMWTRNPAYRGGFFAGAEPLVHRDSRKAREIIGSNWYQDTFNPDWNIKSDSDAAGLFANTKTGFRYCAPSGAGVTGLRFDDTFFDDIEDAQKIYSDPYRYGINREWWPAVSNRLNDMKRGRRTLTMQRLHEDDFAGFVLKTEPLEWDSLILRSKKEEGDIDPDDPRNVGELLFPERFPQSVLDIDVTRLRHMYSAQHQMRPEPLGGGMLKPALMRECEVSGGRAIVDGVSYNLDTLVRFATADIASSTKTMADNTAITIGCRLPDGRIIVEEVQYGQWEIPDTRNRLLAIWTSGRVQYVAVETANAGIGLIQDLRKAGVTVKELKADRDKVTRSIPLKIALDSGRVYRPSFAPWYSDLSHEMASFPKGAHDDLVDSLGWFAIECENNGLGNLDSTPISIPMSSVCMEPWRR